MQLFRNETVLHKGLPFSKARLFRHSQIVCTRFKILKNNGSNWRLGTWWDHFCKKRQMFAWLRTTIPISTIRQWKLKPKDKLYWEWEVRDSKMVAVVIKTWRDHTKCWKNKDDKNRQEL